MASMNLESVPIYISVRRSILETFDCLMRSNVARCSCVSSRAARSWSRLIFSRVSFTRAATLSRASGVIFASSSLKFLAIVLFLQICKVLIVQPIGDGNEDLVPALLAGLVAADRQNGCAIRVERVQHTVWTPLVLNPQFAHMFVPAGGDVPSSEGNEN